MWRRVRHHPGIGRRPGHAGQRNRNAAPAARHYAAAHSAAADCHQARGGAVMMRSTSTRLLAALLALTPATVTPVIVSAQQVSANPADAQKDPVLQAMLAELDRSKQQLQLQGFEKPYFIEYRIDDIGEYEATAGYGALVGERDLH